MRINEIFYSLQGEGFYTGTPSLFIRLSGCNLQCPFCDTEHIPYTDMTEREIIEEAEKCPAKHVVITGGEPSLQLTNSLVEGLHGVGKYVAVETNGTHELPSNVDWITLSPKDHFVRTDAAIVLRRCNEIKVVFTEQGLPSEYAEVQADQHFLQPCDVGDEARNAEILKRTIDYCLAHPIWRLSLQTHKLIGVR